MRRFVNDSVLNDYAHNTTVQDTVVADSQPLSVVHDILGYPDQIYTALDTKRSTGAVVSVLEVQPLTDGRVLVRADIIEPSVIETISHPDTNVESFVSESPTVSDDIVSDDIASDTSSKTSDLPSVLRRLWSLVAPEPLDDILYSGEQCLAVTRRHWLLPLRSAATALAGLPIALAVSWLLHTLAAMAQSLSPSLWWLHVVLWLLALSNVAHMAHRVLWWYADRIIVTDQRLIRACGVLHRQVEATPLVRLRGTTLHRTLWGRIFNYGTFQIGYPNHDLDAEVGDATIPSSRIEFVPHPRHLYQIMQRETRRY